MKFRKKPVVVEAAQWFKNGDHPADYATDQQGMLSGVQQAISGAYRRERDWEGEVVRYFRRPDVSGETRCRHCAQRMHAHGWIDTLEGGHIVCPSDWVITGVKGEHYPCKPDVFAATYEAVDQPVSDDARPTDSESGTATGSAPECLLCTATLARVTALEAEIAALKAERDELQAQLQQAQVEVDVYCPKCGSCGIPECCEAPRCAYFDTYAGDVAGQFREVQADRDDWKGLAFENELRAEAAEARADAAEQRLTSVHANISDALAEHCAKFGDRGYHDQALDTCVRQLVADHDAENRRAMAAEQQIATVRTLSAKWQKDANAFASDSAYNAMLACVDDLVRSLADPSVPALPPQART